MTKKSWDNSILVAFQTRASPRHDLTTRLYCLLSKQCLLLYPREIVHFSGMLR